MRLATYNLENLDFARPDEPAFAARVAALRPHLERLAADVLCLQEVNGQHPEDGGPRQLLALDGLLDGTAYEGYHRAATTGPDGRGVADVHNLVVLSRWPIRAAAEHRHDLVDPPAYRSATARPPADGRAEVRWDRPLLHAAIAHPGGPSLHVVNLHLRAPLAAPIAGQKDGPESWRSLGAWAEGFYLAAIKRGGQALEARLLAERLFDAEPAAWIAICGDCNAELREVPLLIAAGAFEDARDPALLARRLIPVEGMVPAERRFTLRHDGRPLMLDHILASPALYATLSAVEIDNAGLPDEIRTPGPMPGSPHAPMVAVFDLPGRA